MAQALTSDPIMDLDEAQKIFDFTDDDNPIYLVNGLSQKFKAWTGRVQINQAITAGTEIIENVRQIQCPTIYLHSPVYVTDFDAQDVKVEVMYGAEVNNTYLASLEEIVVTTDDFSSRVDLVSGSFPTSEGGQFLRVTYFGGWALIPGDVFQGAIMQGRSDLSRMKGEVGMDSHSQGNGSTTYDQQGILLTVGDLWRPYRVLV